MKRRITVVFVAGVAALGVAACGGDDETTTTTTEATTTTPTGPTGDAGAADSGGAEGEQAVNDLLNQALAAQGLTEGEASCVADLIAPEVSDEQITDLQDPAYVQELLGDIQSEIEECEGQ